MEAPLWFGYNYCILGMCSVANETVHILAGWLKLMSTSFFHYAVIVPSYRKHFLQCYSLFDMHLLNKKSWTSTWQGPHIHLIVSQIILQLTYYQHMLCHLTWALHWFKYTADAFKFCHPSVMEHTATAHMLSAPYYLSISIDFFSTRYSIHILRLPVSHICASCPISVLYVSFFYLL